MRPWEGQEATYQRASAEEPWYEAGLGGVGRDVSAVSVAKAVLDAEREWVPLDITPLVRAWMRSPNLNHGLVIKAAGQIAVQYQFASSEYWIDPSKRPRLQLHMASTTATPVPTETPREATPTATSTGVPTPSATPTAEATPYRFKLALQQGLGDYEGVEDTYLDAWNQTARMGQDGSLRVRRGGVRSALLRYDLEHLPAEARLARAELKLWTAAASNRGDLGLCAYEMLSPWEENLASWLSSSKGRPWWAPGANGLGEDRDGDVVAEILLSEDEQWVSLDVTEIVREWLAHPEDNHGLFLRGEGETNVEYTFASSQWRRLPRQRPKLLLTFDVEPEVIPAEEEKRDLLPWIGVGAGVVVLVVLLLAGRRVRRRRREVVD
jgi:hypothetical protein